MAGLYPRNPLLPDTRPRPIADAAHGYTRWLGLVGSLIYCAAGYGIVTAATADAATGLLGLIPGVVNAATTLAVALGIVHKAEPEVTPLASPRARDGARLLTPDAAAAAASTTQTGTTAAPSASTHQLTRGRRPSPWWNTAPTDGALSALDLDTEDASTSDGLMSRTYLGSEHRDTTPADTPDTRTVSDPPHHSSSASSGHHSPSNDTGYSSSDTGTTSTDGGTA